MYSWYVHAECNPLFLDRVAVLFGGWSYGGFGCWVRLVASSDWVSLSRAHLPVKGGAVFPRTLCSFVASVLYTVLLTSRAMLLCIFRTFLVFSVAVFPISLSLSVLPRRSLYKRTSAAAWNNCC